MGSAASKPARQVGRAATRQYPQKPSSATTKHATAGSPAAPRPSIPTSSTTRSEAIDLDARDPDFAASLRSLGPVTPNPTFSNSSIFNQAQQQILQQQQQLKSTTNVGAVSNPALLTLSSRQRLTDEAQKEFESIGKQSHAGRQYLDVITIKQVLGMREQAGTTREMVERQFRLRPGVLEALGPKGVVLNVR
ncbi:hypothetical protein FQN57_003464 [Myotisia sp. PD_48]|nr:hypothetical protein FQN57_003464 [Myotisia sp. PD_48]